MLQQSQIRPLDRKVNNFREKNITNNNEDIVWSKNTYPHVRFDRTKFQKGRIVDLEKFLSSSQKGDSIIQYFLPYNTFTQFSINPLSIPEPRHFWIVELVRRLLDLLVGQQSQNWPNEQPKQILRRKHMKKLMKNFVRCQSYSKLKSKVSEEIQQLTYPRHQQTGCGKSYSVSA